MPAYILVADDEEAVRAALRIQLEVLGYEVGEAANGLEALRAIQERKPDLVVLDIMMSPLSGWEVLQLLREDPRTSGISVLLLTALSEDKYEALGWHLGCDWYAVKEKPLQLEDLALVVERLLACAPGSQGS